MRKVSFDQSTPEWELWRSKGLGGSDAPIIRGVSEYMTRAALLENKLAHWDHSVRRTNKKKNAAQLRGTRLEPVARDAYIAFTGIHIVAACVIHDEYDWMRASLDGLSLDDQIPVEIKCIKQEYHEVALNNGTVPPCYWPQVQHQLAVCNLPMLHYWSYSESTRFKPEDQKVLVKVRRHEGYIKLLVAEEKAFWEELVWRHESGRKSTLSLTAPKE